MQQDLTPEAYDIQIHPDALDELVALPKKARRQVDQKIVGLAENPRPTNASPLKGNPYKGIWKLRSGDYRIIYQIQDKALVVFVVMVGNRKDIYRKLKRILA